MSISMFGTIMLALRWYMIHNEPLITMATIYSQTDDNAEPSLVNDSALIDDSDGVVALR